MFFDYLEDNDETLDHRHGAASLELLLMAYEDEDYEEGEVIESELLLSWRGNSALRRNNFQYISLIFYGEKGRLFSGLQKERRKVHGRAQIQCDVSKTCCYPSRKDIGKNARGDNGRAYADPYHPSASFPSGETKYAGELGWLDTHTLTL